MSAYSASSASPGLQLHYLVRHTCAHHSCCSNMPACHPPSAMA